MIDLRLRVYAIATLMLAAAVCTAQDLPSGVLKGLKPVPAQPGMEAWKFVSDLQSPLWSDHLWRPRKASPNEADLRGGVRVEANFPDQEKLLETAYADLSDFLKAGNISQNGSFVIETARADTPVFEAYRIEATKDRCRILAADAEGIRRGIFQVEDMMLRAGGPFLPVGTLERKPFIKSRISRCFFGPIKRPPMNRDELTDDVDYYPDQYLNRFAHDGINGLWLTIAFKDLCKTSVISEYGNDAQRRLAKLRKTVEKCRRYGIRIYLFAIEPAAWNPGEPVLQRHPELGGTPAWNRRILVCPWSETVQKYLYEATHGIFSAVPHLGGLINITHGERPTTCLSAVSATHEARLSCPRCSKREPWEIIRRTLEPMARGMRDANPDAELLAWFYMPYENGELADWVYEIPKHFPENVVLQFNFESGVTREDFGRGRKGGDYWLSVPGPSQRFDRMARLAQLHRVPTSAKIQTGCSHEVATVPFVPVPGLLYQKFRAMRELGVSRVMLCWYFGNYPGVMNKAAGRLSFEPFPKTECEFLDELASVEWGKHADAVARAWRLLAEGYGHFPLTNRFQYFGPMHDGVVWPLLLRPQDAPLAPTWLLASSETTPKPFAPSGDRIGECLGQAYTLAEAVELCRAMSDRWDEGLQILREVESDPALSTQRRLDIGVARALGIQFRSGLNILRFYDLRDRLSHAVKPAERLALLDEMQAIVESELRGGEELFELCRRDSRLGFHSEAEGYKYYPEKIRWRMDQLQRLLDEEIPALRREISDGADVFAEYAGREPKGPTARSVFCADIARRLKQSSQSLPAELDWQTCPAGSDREKSNTRWAICHDREALYFLFDCDDSNKAPSAGSNLYLAVEPRRMWPCLHFEASRVRNWWESQEINYESSVQAKENGWCGWIRMSFAMLGFDPAELRPLRINVVRTVPGSREQAWIARHPWPHRLLLVGDNPTDLGWLYFKDK